MNMKWLLNTIILIAATMATTGAFAGTGAQTKPAVVKQNNQLELKQVGKDKILISCNLVAADKEYYEIERSSDNHVFTTVCLVFPATANEQMRNGISLKEKVAEHQTFYYRLKKVSGNEVTYTEAKSIKLN